MRVFVVTSNASGGATSRSPGPARWSRGGRLAAALFLTAATLQGQASPAGSLAAGDLAWTARRYPEARAAYDQVLAADSAASTRALYRVAVMRTWDGDLKGAIPLFALYTRLEPGDEEGRVALARAHAWNGEAASAVAIYDSILSRDATYRDAALGAAQALAWAGRHVDALARYERWLSTYPKDVEAALARARTLTWAGRLVEAEREYERLSRDGERLEAAKGAALVAAWRGHLFRSEGLWRSLVTRYPRDAEAWVGLAQVLRWSGRPGEARTALDAAMAADPANTDSREQRRWVQADLAPAATPEFGTVWDSDGNRTSSGGVRAQVRPSRRSLATIGIVHRMATLGTTTATSDALRGSWRWSPARRLTLSGDLGVARLVGETSPGVRGPPRQTTVASAAATVALTSSTTVGASYAREAFDETAPLIRRGIVVHGLYLEGTVQLPANLSLGLHAARAAVLGGSEENVRDVRFGALRWRPKRQWLVAAGVRTIAYEKALRDGYFSPREYTHEDLAVRWMPGGDLGFSGWVEAGLGSQLVRLDGPANRRVTQRGGVGVAWRPRPGVEWSVGYSNSSVATAANILGGRTGYRAQSLTLGARLRR